MNHNDNNTEIELLLSTTKDILIYAVNNFNKLVNVILIYAYIFGIRIFNLIFRISGYTKVYDLNSGIDITVIYWIVKIFSQMQKNNDMIYSCLGVCTSVNGKYVRYVCYNTGLSKITNFNLSSKKYQNIKKIEIENNSKIIDVTDSIKNFYDCNNFTRFIEIIRFYKIINKQYFESLQLFGKIKIIIHREYYDPKIKDIIYTQEIIENDNI